MNRLVAWLRHHLRTRVEASTWGDGIGAGREFAQRARQKRRTWRDTHWRHGLYDPEYGNAWADWDATTPRRWRGPAERTADSDHADVGGYPGHPYPAQHRRRAARRTRST